MKIEYKNFGRVNISSYIYYVIMRKDKYKMKTLEQLAEEVYTSRGYTDVRGHSIRNIIGQYIEPVKPHVVAIGTSGGKTWTTAAKIEFLFKNGYLKKGEKVLIVAADRTILQSNFITQFNKFFKSTDENSCGDASFSYRAVSNKKDLEDAITDDIDVIITIPQSINSKSKLDLLSTMNFKWYVQDEAHKWYFRKTVKKILNKTKPKYQMLLTGTPFKFNLRRKDYLIDYTPVSEMYQKGYLSDFTAQVLHSDIEVSKMDYNGLLGNLKKKKKFTDDETTKVFSSVVKQMIKKLETPFKGLASTHNITKDMLSLFGTLQKTIIFTNGTKEADCVYQYLQNNGVGSLISHSSLKDDDPDKTFDLFKEDDSVKVLVAVNRGKEGFDFEELYNVIDMSYSKNFEVVMQIIGRVLRKNDKIKMKYFFKVAPKHQHGFFNAWMNALFMLFDKTWYSAYNGKNGFDIEIPIVSGGKKKTKKKKTTGSGGSKRPTTPTIESLDYMMSLSFMEENKWFRLSDKLSTVSSSTLSKVVGIHIKDRRTYTFDMVGKYKSLVELISNDAKLAQRLLRFEQEQGFDFYYQFDDYKQVPNNREDLLDWLRSNIPSLSTSVKNNPYWTMGLIKEREINRVN